MKLNQIFYEIDYSQAYEYAIAKGYTIKEIEADEHGRRFKIVEIPKPTEEEILNNMRFKREYECFPIINRGECWYAKLTDEQKSELSQWYDAWLDVTETKVVPTKPTWLK